MFAGSLIFCADHLDMSVLHYCLSSSSSSGSKHILDWYKAATKHYSYTDHIAIQKIIIFITIANGCVTSNVQTTGTNYHFMNAC